MSVIAGHLAWLPESDGELDAGHELADGEAIRALSLCPEQIPAPPADLQHLYRVPHYAPAAIGRGFGPLSLDMVLRFCYRLDELLRAGKVILYTERENKNERVNSAMLVGAYLILKRGWQVGEAVSALGADAKLKFVCSFAPKQQPEPARALHVSDCWSGLALAVRLEWLNAQCLCSKEEMQVTCDQIRFLADSCDAAWLIPGKLLICADPVTTANDPNPHTFKHVFPQDTTCLSHASSSASTSTPLSSPRNLSQCDDEEQEAPRSRSSSKEAAHNTLELRLPLPIEEETQLQMQSEEPRISIQSSVLVEETQLQMQSEDPRISILPCVLVEDRLATPRGKVPASFVDMARECGIRMVVRTNSMQESGMVEKSYPSKRLAEHGIRHADIVLLDGASPTRQEVRKMLRCCEGLMMDERSGSGLLVHCKGGFGRSVIMACCVIISSLDVSGAALLGWVRLARPGAINTPRQEKFLLSMKGSDDIERYTRVESTCGLGPQCSVQ